MPNQQNPGLNPSSEKKWKSFVDNKKVKAWKFSSDTSFSESKRKVNKFLHGRRRLLQRARDDFGKVQVITGWRGNMGRRTNLGTLAWSTYLSWSHLDKKAKNTSKSPPNWEQAGFSVQYHVGGLLPATTTVSLSLALFWVINITFVP